ncbi:MAG: ParB/RepB/Spo0J family partition protein [Patescibacteria group bacterium]|nr:ParB/RepB/Spo0J family partition protein [Patescibacteria group bacterium]
MKAKIGLGRGFESLIPSDFNKDLLLSQNDVIRNLDIKSLKPNPNQPRKKFDQNSLDELASSIQKYGVIQPILVTPKDKNSYYIVAGERRWRASIIAGLKIIPAIIKHRKELEQLEVAIIENVQRVNLSPMEQSISIAKLKQQFNLTFEEIAQKLGKANTTIINTYRLINLPEMAKKALIDNKITEGHARQILAIKDPGKQHYLLNSIIKNGWTVRKAEQFVIGLKSSPGEVSKAKAHTNIENKKTKLLSKKLSTRVSIRRMAHGGKLEINFFNEDDLDRILKLFIEVV